jgi:hypothetical protein
MEIIERESMSERALFKPVKATLGLSGITAMNTAMTNVLLAAMVFKGQGNPSSPTDIFKDVSDRVIQMVLKRAEDNKFTKKEMAELIEIANAYAEVLKAIK